MSHAGSATLPRRGLRHWLAGRTLRGRLIAGLVALLAVACAAVGIVTYLSLRGYLLSQLDGNVQAASARFASCVNPPPGYQPPDSDHDNDNGRGNDNGPHPGEPAVCADTSGQAVGTFSAALTAGAITTANVTYGSCHLHTADKLTLARLPVNGHAYTERLYSPNGDYRLMATRGANGQILVTGLPMTGMTDTLQNVELTEAIVFAAALLLTGIIGTGWVRLSLRPLRRVTATAAEVTRLPLGSGEVALPNRVPGADPRTEVGQLGVAFNRMLGHVESALTRRHASEARLRTFAADASHELRTPLAAIRGYAELARRHPGGLPDDVAHALTRVEAESARMSGLVDDLLLLARLDAGRPLADEPV